MMYPKPKLTKNRSRKRACEIPKQVRIVVALRDKGKCIFCGRLGKPNAHLVKRSQGGLGVEQNIFTACLECHYEEDFGKNCKEYEARAESYLKGVYGTKWSRDNLIYKKYKIV